MGGGARDPASRTVLVRRLWTRVSRTLLPGTAAVAVGFLGACQADGGGDTVPGAVAEMNGADRLPGPVVGRIQLEESDTTLVVAPYLNVGDEGDLWIADALEQRVLRYAKDGHLIRAFGRKGSGPGEFVAPMRALPLSPDSVLVVDPGRGALILDSHGVQIGTLQVPLGTLTDAVRVGPAHLALSGRSAAAQATHRVALLEVASGRVVSLLVSPALSRELQLLEASFGFVKLAARGDTLAAIHSLIDSIWIRSPDGVVETVPLRHLEPRPALPTDYLTRSRREVVRELRRHHDLFLLTDGRFLVQSVTGGAGEETWELSLFESWGEEVRSWRAAPRMVGLWADTALFIDPASLTPNRWVAVWLGR